jgi:hypothetical protein
MSTPRTITVVISVTALVVLVTACGGTTSGTTGGTTSASSCSDLASGAQKDVAAVIDAHRSCTQASDCTTVALSASCFDSCSRAMRKDAADALKAAQDKANQTQCVQFSNQGCKTTIPPCEPPTPPTCQNGVCTG